MVRGGAAPPGRAGNQEYQGDPDEVISYISNEGVRISRILARVDELSQNAKTPELRSAAARVRDAVADAAGLPSDGPFSRASSPVVVMEDPDQTVPKPSAALRTELAPRLDKPGEFLLPFRHFTTAMHARRRLPVFAAINLDGKKMPDDTIFSDMLQRGHMAARES